MTSLSKYRFIHLPHFPVGVSTTNRQL